MEASLVIALAFVCKVPPFVIGQWIGCVAYVSPMHLLAYEAMLRYLSAGVRLVYLPQVMVQMQVGGASNRSVKQLIRKSREDYHAIRRHRIGGAGTLISKNLSKLPQFLRHP